MVLSKLFIDFFKSERAGGLVLLCCAIFSIAMTNFYPAYNDVWHMEIGTHSVTHWINDGLMTIFFLLVGLELEREIYIGELSSVRNASLPVIAALGGMLIPAALYSVFNEGHNLKGFGIPMATDIAFAIGVLSLLGDRVPSSLKVFLTALAVIDDLGAIIVIAIFYTSDLNLVSFALALGIMAFLFLLNRMKVYALWIYLVAGIFMWYFMMNSGVHATLAGVLLAFVIPFGNGDERSISHKLQHALHKPVAFFILPIFALANTSIFLPADFTTAFVSTISLGIMAGLVIGKPAGIFLFSYVAVKLKISALPPDSRWSYILGAGLLGGIGFTMSIFISLLAFDEPTLVDQSKIAIIVASLVAGIAGLFYLKTILKKSV